jgi:hypothetical protein
MDQTRIPGLPDCLFSKSKVLIWVNFVGPCNGRYWYILWLFCLSYGHLVYFSVLVFCTKKKLAILPHSME